MGRVRCDKLFCHMNTKISIIMAKARRPLGCGVRKFGILLTVMAAAIIALPNTVTNDVVVATSDAELRISDRDLGLFTIFSAMSIAISSPSITHGPAIRKKLPDSVCLSFCIVISYNLCAFCCKYASNTVMAAIASTTGTARDTTQGSCRPLA